MEISAARSHAAKIVPNATFATDSPLSHWEDPSLNLQSPSRMEKSSSTEAKPVGSCDVGQYPLAVLTDFRFPSAEPIEGRPRPMDRYSTAMGVSHQVKPPSCSQPLQPMQLYSVARSVAPTDPTANNGRRISALEDFEFQSGSPFDSLALKSLNDLEELKAVLQMPTITQSNGQ